MVAKKYPRGLSVILSALILNGILFTLIPNLLKRKFPQPDIEHLQVVDFISMPPDNTPAEKKRPLPKKEPLPQIPPPETKKRIAPAKPKPEPLRLKTPPLDIDVEPQMAPDVIVKPPRKVPPTPQPVKKLAPTVQPNTTPAPRQVSDPKPVSPPPKAFYSANEVDAAPVVIRKKKPVYPYRARRLNLEGEVSVRFLVTKNGTVDKITIIKANPKKIFDANVLKALPTWRFEPGKVKGLPVNTWVTTTITFRLNE